MDLDGLEEYKILSPILISFEKAAPAATSISLKLTTKLALITTAKGISDALVNANTIGISDGFFGTNRLESYENDDEKGAYLRGRIAGDVMAITQGLDEASVGGGVALSTGVVTFGVGAATGLAVGLHGTGVIATATADAAWAVKQLYKLNATANDASGGTSSSQPKKFEPLANTKAGKKAIEENGEIPKGFKETKEFNRSQTKGQRACKKGERYISPDKGQKDGSPHNGGVWKEFKKVGKNLKRIGR